MDKIYEDLEIISTKILNTANNIYISSEKLLMELELLNKQVSNSKNISIY